MTKNEYRQAIDKAYEKYCELFDDINSSLNAQQEQFEIYLQLIEDSKKASN